MKYVVMLVIVIGLAAVDFITGLIKAAVKNDVSSKKMRTGGLNKICEILVMLTACGLEIGIEVLGGYYQAPTLARIAGVVAAGLIFTYIVAMEIVSILENYGEVNPEARWIRFVVKKLRIFQQKEEEDNDVHSEDKT